MGHLHERYVLEHLALSLLLSLVPPSRPSPVPDEALSRPQQPDCTPMRRSRRPRSARRRPTCRSSSRATSASTASLTRSLTCAAWTVRPAPLRLLVLSLAADLFLVLALARPPAELRKLGGPSFAFSPSDILVVEDAPSGLKSGLDAGCKTLGVSTGQPMARFRTFDATVKTVDLTRCVLLAHAPSLARSSTLDGRAGARPCSSLRRTHLLPVARLAGSRS